MQTRQTTQIDATALETLLAAAVAAPSIHNTQPWRFGMDPGTRTVTVRLDRRRSLPLTDPDRRAQYLSVGTAVLNLRVAVAHLGWEPVVRLLPDHRDPDLLATVRLVTAAGDPPDLPDHASLYPAIARRHTSRLPFTGRPVPEPVLAEMAAAARAEGARLYFPDFGGTRRLLRLTAAAEDRNRAFPDRAAEARTWVTTPDAHSRYGIPVTALGPQDAAGRMPMRDFTGPLRALRLPRLPFERHVQLALLWTARDRAEDWLRAGQGLERVLLTAAAHGVRTSMLHQAMEWPDLRAAARLPQRRCSPHLLVRFGYGPEGAPSPRAGTHAPDLPEGAP
ncbi:nitroreductase family protein [Streptomyces sp. B93]|uniref:Acg family FMN-binding oxidoreductase n=1 Tax=Streptomyces sp. B93 TaxID=2824875 RepID=UPI001B35CFDA|nr:nitroreductase family protein [Streptomyces sp. B93]MBQ1090310.1 nitroreductase family protein [Streptomyces sp. B93]